MNNWKSSVLRFFVSDDHCLVCKFLAGNRDPETLIEVIRILDKTCGDAEAAQRQYLKLVVDQLSRRN